MIFQKFYKNNEFRPTSRPQCLRRGSILMDVLLALSIATLFIVMITETFDIAKRVFSDAEARNYFLKVYSDNAYQFSNMLPFEERSALIGSDNSKISNNIGTTTINARAIWYGNDRVETIISVGGLGEGGFSSKNIVFSQIRVYSSDNISDWSVNPICSVDFGNDEIVGSYPYLSHLLDQNKLPNISTANTFELNIASTTAIILPVNPLLPLTDLEIRGKIAYISSDSTAASDPDIIVADITDKANPLILSSINTGPGISAFTLVGNRIFAAAASTVAQLHIVRLNNLSSPILEKKYQLPLPYATATPPTASAIYYYDNKVYLGTTKWDGEEFSVIDVSNPMSPTKIGGFEIGSKVEDIFLRGDLVYVASAGATQLNILDISDPTHIKSIDYFSPTGWERQEGKVVSYFEGKLYLGRTSGGFDITNDHELFSWGNSSSSVAVPNSNPPNVIHSVNFSGGIYGILPQRSNIISVTRKGNSELTAFKHNLSATSSLSYPLPISPQALTCFGNRVYVLAHSAPAIYEIIKHEYSVK